MASTTATTKTPESKSANMDRGTRKRILIFSPDADLARTLLLIMEDEFDIVRETRLESLAGKIAEIVPDLILVDLFAFTTDIVKQLEVVRRSKHAIPIIILRGYYALTPAMNEAIDELADMVFYKPVDVDLVTQAIQDVMKH